jgi:hypothetical protein
MMPISTHGDAALAAPGVVGQTLQLSPPRGYRTGGAVHVVTTGECAKRQRRRGGCDGCVSDIPSIISIRGRRRVAGKHNNFRLCRPFLSRSRSTAPVRGVCRLGSNRGQG